MVEAITKIDDFQTLIRKRHTIRRFKPDPVPDEYIRKVIDVARWSPSPSNAQTWEFIVIKNSQTKKAIADIMVEAAERNRRMDPSYPLSHEPTLRLKYQEAPVLIVTCSDPRFKRLFLKTSSGDRHIHVSIGAAIHSMHLAAVALGLGCCWGTVHGTIEKQQIRELLGIPEALDMQDITSIGFPDEEPRERYCRSLEEVLHREKLDTGKLRTEEHIDELGAKRTNPDLYFGWK